MHLLANHLANLFNISKLTSWSVTEMQPGSDYPVF